MTTHEGFMDANRNSPLVFEQDRARLMKLITVMKK
jgi:hypothetical protein